MKKIMNLLIIGMAVIVAITGLFFWTAIVSGIFQDITNNNNNNVNIQEDVKIEKEEKAELKEVELQAGFYTVGEDIEPGKYDIVHIDGQGLVDINDEYCFQIGTDRDYGDTEIVKNVELKEGDKIRVTSGLWFKFVPVQK